MIIYIVEDWNGTSGYELDSVWSERGFMENYWQFMNKDKTFWRQDYIVSRRVLDENGNHSAKRLTPAEYMESILYD